MNRTVFPPPGDATQELSALIEELHATEQRLEQLTAGQVDTVANRAGRTILLQHAQDEMRHSEAAKQAAILNALPAHIALVDSRGLIVSVNETWRRAGPPAVIQAPGHAVGRNYVEICDNALGDEGFDAQQVADGLRSVLRGEAASFSIEYACGSTAGQRWFLLKVTPLADDDLPRGAVVMHLDVTAQRQAEESLRVSELRFRQMAENIREVFWLTDPAKDQVLYLSPAFEEIWGRSCESVYASPREWIAAVHPEDRERVHAAQARQADGNYAEEYRIVRPDGTIRWVRDRAFPVLRNEREVYRIAGLAEDITERKEAQDRIVSLNRVYAILSGINSLIVRVRDRGELFREACRIAVEGGGFRMAMIGIVDPVTRLVVPVAAEGKDQAIMAAIRDRLSSPDAVAPTLVGRAVAEKKAVVANDAQIDPRVVFGRQYAASAVRSMAVLPLIVGGEVAGVLALFAGEAEFFHDEEVKLLTGLADDIAFAIDHLDKQERLAYLAYYDVLTGLANRHLFLERVAQYMRSAAGNGHKLAVYLIDLERFKSLNDNLGQATGDALLRQVAEWLTHNVRDANLVARVDADHFAVVLPEVVQEGDVARLLEKSLKSFLDHEFHLKDTVFRIAAKVGVALFPDDGGSADMLYAHAEAALKKAKASGERYLFYTQKMTATMARRLTLENQLRQALDREEFVLYYQPKVNMRSGNLTGAEALLRWNDPRSGLVLPGLFVPILEETGLIHEVGRWALHRAIADYLRWRNAGLAAVRIAVNVSPLQLRNRGYVDEIRQAVGIGEQTATGLELEITESMVMEDTLQNIASLQAIRALGVRIAIDDFGTGFSSLSYLSRLPVDTLKIDRSFVLDMGVTQEGLALVSTIITLAHSLKLAVVAEGVETGEQARLLRLLNCDEMQGNLISTPLPCAMFEDRFLTVPPAG
ncbi:MAG: EAL domain-containing protein [Casimicrobiaceae bacterium]